MKFAIPFSAADRLNPNMTHAELFQASRFPALLTLCLFASSLGVRLLTAADTNSPGSLSLPPHPRLLLDSNGIVQLKQRLQIAAWAKDSWAELKSNADRTLNRPIDLPPRGGNWSHNYVCPTHSARLSQGKQIGPWQWEHLCPVGHHVLRGDPGKASMDFDGNAIAAIHGRLAQQTINFGLLYQVTGDVRYARKAREILLAYAGAYLSYPLHDNQGRVGKGGRVASQSLTEASWLIEIAQGADLVWNTLSPADEKAIADQLFRPALDQVILPSRLGIHNIQCRHNSAIGLVGFLLADTRLISIAIDDPARGFRQQLAQGVREDGMWLEGSSGYHFFTIAGLWPLAEAARNCGLSLYDERFRSLFDGPLNLAMPNLVLPNFNDSGTVPLRNEDALYELAYARFHHPAYVPLLSQSDRSSRLALLFGVPELPRTATVAPPGSHNSPASGYAILQNGRGENATWVCVKYGPHGGGHGHPDKNTFILYARGQIVATDAGTHAYGSPLHKDWDKTTFAHNTLVVDEKSQEQATGASLALGSDHGVDFSITDAGPIYPGVHFQRTVALLSSNLVLFVDQVQADSPHVLDLVYHQVGDWDASQRLDANPWPDRALPGYTRFREPLQRTLTKGSLTLNTTLAADWHSTLVLEGNEPTEVIAGYGVLKTTEDRVPLLIQRRHAKQTAFVWAVSLEGTPVELTTSTVQDATGTPLAAAEAVCVRAHLPGGREWLLAVNPHKKQLQVKLPDNLLRTTAPFALLSTGDAPSAKR